MFSCILSNIIYFLLKEEAPAERVEFTKIMKGFIGVMLKGTNRALGLSAGANSLVILNYLKRKEFASLLTTAPSVLTRSSTFHIANTHLISISTTSYSSHFDKEEKTELLYQ